MGRSDHTFTPSNRHYRFGNDRDVFGAYRCSVCPKQKQKFRLFCHVSAWMFVKSREIKRNQVSAKYIEGVCNFTV